MNKEIIKKEYKKEKGFTILETLVAIFILTISLTGPLAFAQSGLRAAFLARDQITAFYLAQDAVETIKNIRDQNKLDNINASGPTIDWLEGLDNCTSSTPCSIDTTTPVPVVTACTAGSECPPLYYKESNGYFTHATLGNEQSLFTRTIYINETVSGSRAQVVVLVTWVSKALSGVRKIVIQEDINDWLPVGS